MNAAPLVKYNHSINRCKNQGRWMQALHLLGILKEKQLQPNSITYCNTISACARCQEWQTSLHLFAEACEQNDLIGGVLDVTLYNAVLSACEKAAEWQRALCLLMEMELRDLQADVISYNSSISSCEKAGHWKEALCLFVDLLEQRMKVTTITFNSAMSACEKNNEHSAVQKLFLMMHQHKVEPDRITHNVAISACQDPGSWSLGLHFFHAASLVYLEPNSVTLSAVASVCEVMTQWRISLELLDRPHHNVISFNATISSMATWIDALLLFNNTRQHGHQPSVITSNTVIRHLNGDWHRAVDLISSARRQRILDVITFNSTINNCHRHGLWEQAIQILDEVCCKETSPNIITYGAVASSCEVSLKWQHALLLAQAVHHQHVAANSIIYNTAMSTCDRATQWEHALYNFQLQKSPGQADLTSFNIAISACEKNALWCEALSLLDYLDDHWQPDVISFTSAVGACAKMKKWEEAVALFVTAFSRSVRCNVLTFALGCNALEGVTSALTWTLKAITRLSCYLPRRWVRPLLRRRRRRLKQSLAGSQAGRSKLRYLEHVIYIAPLKALARERMEDWEERFQRQLGKIVVELTGDFTPDIDALERADVVVTTPEKWDGISRHWQHRAYVRKVGLVIIDEIHLLGQDRGPVLEVIVSRMRYISCNLDKGIRFVGLSTALANAHDIADWLGIGIVGLYNFKPSVRPVPMTAHIQGYPEKHFVARMAQMNKPCFHAIKNHAVKADGIKPTLIFVSSRRQTRLTALDIVAFMSADPDEDPKQFCKLEPHELECAGVGGAVGIFDGSNPARLVNFHVFFSGNLDGGRA
eukprot:symbB.v1.2.030519.t1/scaffold3447.1/size56486/4